MIAKKEDFVDQKPVIDLSGPEGNAYVLMGYAKQWASQLDLDFNKIIDEMMSGNYENLLNVLEKYFGDYIILLR